MENSNSSKSGTVGEKLYKAGVAGLAGFVGPAAGVLGLAAMIGATTLVAKYTGAASTAGMTLEAVQVLSSAVTLCLTGLAGVGLACHDALEAYSSSAINQVSRLKEKIKGAGLTLGAGLGVAALTVGSTAAMRAIPSLMANSSSPWMTGAIVVGTLVSGYVALSGTLATPMIASMMALDVAKGEAATKSGVQDIGNKLKDRRDRHEASQAMDARPAVKMA
jgi:hypothetical protein